MNIINNPEPTDLIRFTYYQTNTAYNISKREDKKRRQNARLKREQLELQRKRDKFYKEYPQYKPQEQCQDFKVS